MTKNAATKNCTEQATCRTCVPESTTYCATCAMAVIVELQEEVDSLRADVDGIDVDDFVTEGQVERMIERELEDSDRFGISEDDCEDKIDRAISNLRSDSEEQFATDTDVSELRDQVEALQATVETLTAAVDALQARTLSARYARFSRAVRTFLRRVHLRA